MVRVLSEEESKKVEKEVDEFLLSLDFNTKQRIKTLIESFQQQIECEHNWIDPNSYENELPKNKLFCRCGATKLTNEAKMKQFDENIRKYSI